VAPGPNFGQTAIADSFGQRIDGLTPGRQITVTFEHSAAFFQNVDGDRQLVSGPGYWAVSLGAESSDGSVLSPPRDPGRARPWSEYSITFTPRDTSATLRFQAVNASTNPNASAFLGIDNIRITCDAPVAPTVTPRPIPTPRPTVTDTIDIMTATPAPIRPTPLPTVVVPPTVTPVPATALPTTEPSPTPTNTPVRPTSTPTSTPTPTPSPAPTPTTTPPTATPEPTLTPTPTPAPAGELKKSGNDQRRASSRLEGSTINAGEMTYLFLDADEDTDIRAVVFVLNGERVRLDPTAPFDLVASNRDGTAEPYVFDESQVGELELSAFIQVGVGLEVVTAKFRVTQD